VSDPTVFVRTSSTGPQPCPRCDRDASGEWRDGGEIIRMTGFQGQTWLWFHQDAAGDWVRCNRWQDVTAVGEKPTRPLPGRR